MRRDGAGLTVTPVARKERLAPETISAIGKRVRTLIDETSNLHAFTLRTGIAYQTILAWEKGTKQPELPLLFKIARALGVPVHRFFVDLNVGAPDEPWEDSPGWLELVTSGRIDRYREDGVTEAQIEAARRWPFVGEPETADYIRLLDAALLGARTQVHRSHLRRRSG